MWPALDSFPAGREKLQRGSPCRIDMQQGYEQAQHQPVLSNNNACQGVVELRAQGSDRLCKYQLCSLCAVFRRQPTPFDAQAGLLQLQRRTPCKILPAHEIRI